MVRERERERAVVPCHAPGSTFGCVYINPVLLLVLIATVLAAVLSVYSWEINKKKTICLINQASCACAL